MGKLYTQLKKKGPAGLLLVCLTVVCVVVSKLSGLPVMLYALVAGMLCGKLGRRENFIPVVLFSSRRLLRAGVALLGVKISFQEVFRLGWGTVGVVVFLVATTLLLGLLLAPLLRQKKELGILAGGATAICGASAALAISSTLPDHDGRIEEYTLATIAAINIYSTVAMLLYPLLAHAIGFDDLHAGIFLGSTIHDVAQVVGAGLLMNEKVVEIATVVKLLRVALLSVAVVILTLSYSHRHLRHSRKRQALIPGYLVVFFLLIAINSFGVIPPAVGNLLNKFSTWLLVLAVIALGMKTHFSALKKSGSAVFAIVLVATLFIGVGGLAASIWLL